MARLAAIVVPVAVAVLLLGYRLGSTGLWSDESIYAQTAREMARSGDWITPHVCGKPYLIKPVLYHWLAALAFRILGETELAARLPQALAGLLGIAVVASFGTTLYGSRTGTLAGLVLATATGFAIGARVAGMDLLLTAGITLSLVCFFRGYREARLRRAWFLASGFGAGIALLAKGPVGAVVPSMVVLAFLLLRRDPSVVFSRPALEGIAVGLATAAIWYLPVWILHGHRFTHVFWINNNLARILEPVSDHAGPVTYYIPVFFLAFLPWSFPFGTAVVRAAVEFFRRPLVRRDPAGEFLWIWFLVPFVFYSLISTKLPGYLLPIFPAAALLTAREWEARSDAASSRSGWYFRGACALGVASLPGVALAVPFLLAHRYGMPPAQGWLFPAATFLPAAVAAFSALATRGKVRSLWWVAAAAVFVLGLVRFAVIPAERYESMKEMTISLLERREAGYPVALAGAHLRGTLFYAACTVPQPRDINDLPRPAPGLPLYCLVKDRFRSDLEAWAERGDFTLRAVESRGPLSLMEVKPEPAPPPEDRPPQGSPPLPAPGRGRP